MSKQNKQPRPHAELIKAWADGATIQTLTWGGSWIDIDDPTWGENVRYRVKPKTPKNQAEPKPKMAEHYFAVSDAAIVNEYVWTNGVYDHVLFDAGNCFQTRDEAEAAAERVRAALKGEEPEELKKLRRENEELKTEIDVLDEEIDEIREALNALSDGEKALIEALRLTPSFEPLWGNFKVLDCDDETLIGLATVAVDTGNWVASPHRIFQALKQIAGEKRKGGEHND